MRHVVPRLSLGLRLSVFAALVMSGGIGHCIQPRPDATPMPPMPALEPPGRPGFLHPHLPPEVPTLRGNTAWVPVLIEGLAAEDGSVRARSAFLLGLVGDAEAASPLCERLGDTVRDVRVHAGIALGMLRDARGLGTCRAVLGDAEEWVSYYAVQGLARIGSERAVAALRGCAATNESAYVREAAELALKALREGNVLQPGPERPTGGDRSPNRQGDTEAETLEDIFLSASDVLWLLTDFPWHLGNHPDAIRLNQVVAFLDPHFTDAYEVTAWLLWSADRDEEAMRWRIKGLRANPDVYDLYFDIGFWHFQQNDYEKAIRYLSRAATFECPEHVRHTLAHALERGGRPEEALAVWAELLEENPEHAVARLNYDRIKGQR